ncbi:hypothetical protein H8356DRAFT_1692138 [Neocallimastix lanati (nom. inval.)]|uniref:Uncharacterized protein n=1 Tax=Neocallimastix californiae TaxID=1754190 RepID=A0A1Y2DG91_9FUNG|nr:hypothetical protein H8356DRAFT_1692138 [Neocallimastix sp. JGI-2020a]ORY58313.1 hypothetical protein LY90DRAFT_250539 [Neocallimastix californiae]|eukprot:ORY58313.1 hypothetical protein LY90DRAFT_250539 [Neocallimastix californiae]
MKFIYVYLGVLLILTQYVLGKCGFPSWDLILPECNGKKKRFVIKAGEEGWFRCTKGSTIDKRGESVSISYNENNKAYYVKCNNIFFDCDIDVTGKRCRNCSYTDSKGIRRSGYDCGE